MGGKVSGLPVERYIGIDPARSLPLMICRDVNGRHWVTDGTRSAVIYPDERDTSAHAEGSYAIDFYTVERASSLLSTVDPFLRTELPYDELVYANWLVMATHDLMLEYPQGTTAIERVALDRDSFEARDQLILKVQGAEKSFRIRRLLPRRPGRFDITVRAQDDATVLLMGTHSLLDLEMHHVFDVRPGETRDQAREIVDRILDFVWDCRSQE